MKKFRVLCFVMCIMAAFMAVSTAQAEIKTMWATVYADTGKTNASGRNELTPITSGITFKVLQRNSDSSETLYVRGSTTSLTNPVSTTNFASASYCNAMVAFDVDPTDTTSDRYVDLIVTDTNGGYSKFVEDFDTYTHSIVIDERPNVRHHGMIWATATTTVEYDTGIDFLADTLIDDVRVEIVTVLSAGTLDVGLLSSETSGDADGLRDGVLTTTAGFVADTGIITAGTTGDYYPDSTYGALLYQILAGADSATATDRGGRTFLGHVVTGTNAKSLTFTSSSATTTDGYIHYFFTRLR